MTEGSPEQLGVHQVERELGRGGMGVVYLARDTRLDRQVAIKALPEDLVDDAERLERFEREAKMLASLSHPNVAGIYGVEEHGGALYLVLEFVEGETLASRLARGPLPVDEAVDIAVQIAAAVEAAHEAGVVHRDLKPGNVIVTPDGQAKVLDFGLARIDDAGVSASGLSMSPTLTSPLQESPTMPGVILGTAAYMSPEQARGRPVDKRSDVWSFGILLYELLTGLRPFQGETVSDSIGAILHKPVDLSRLPAGTPAQVRRVIERCLVRDRRERLRDIGDARIELTSAESAPEAERSPRGRVVAGFGVIAAVGALSLGVVGGRQLAPSSEGRLGGPLHVAIPIDVGNYIDRDPETPSFDISPDGSMIAFIGTERGPGDEYTPPVVYLRSLESAERRRLAGTENARSVSFSPSGRQLAVSIANPDSQGERIVRLTVDGGPALPVLDDAGGVWSGRAVVPWLDEETVVVSSSGLLRLFRVDVAQRQPELVVDLEQTIPDLIFAAQVHPVGDGRNALFWGVRMKEGVGPDASIYHLDFETGETRLVLDNAAGGFLLHDPDRLVFVRDGALCAAPIDLVTFEVQRPIVAMLSNRGDDAYRLSRSGDIIYTGAASEPVRRRILTADRSGNTATLFDFVRDFNGEVRVSPAGDQLAVIVANPNPVLNVIDLETGFMRPVSPIDEAVFEPVWTPDGRLAYNRIRSLRDQRHFVLDLDGGGAATPLVPGQENPGWAGNVTFTPDGAFAVMVRRSGRDASGDLYLVDLSGDTEPIPMTASSASELMPTLSPDGTLLAYLTDVSGVPTVAIQPFDVAHPASTQSMRTVSQIESTCVFWSARGDEIFWIERRDGDWHAVMGATVSADETLLVGPPREILTRDAAPFHVTYGSSPVHLLPDGERFVFIEDVGESRQPAYLRVILNWSDEVTARLEAAAE